MNQCKKWKKINWYLITHCFDRMSFESSDALTVIENTGLDFVKKPTQTVASIGLSKGHPTHWLAAIHSMESEPEYIVVAEPKLLTPFEVFKGDIERLLKKYGLYCCEQSLN